LIDDAREINLETRRRHRHVDRVVADPSLS
jgi:hypothetical protein